MLLQPKYTLPYLSSWTSQSTAHKRENRPIKQGLKNLKRLAHSITRREGYCREKRQLQPGKAGTQHHPFGQNLPTRTVTKISGHYLIGNSNSVGQQGLSMLHPTQPRIGAQAPTTRPEERSLPIPTPGNGLH
jgi:hypothetical protein